MAWIPRLGWTDDDQTFRDYADEPMFIVARGEVLVDDPLTAAVMRLEAEHDGLYARLIDVHQDAAERLSEAWS